MLARPLFGRVVATDGAGAAHEYPAGLLATSHFHDHSYLSIILRGQTTERFSGRSETLGAGAVHLMTAGERHSNAYEADTRCLHIEADAILERVGDRGPGPFRDARATILGDLIAGEFQRHDDLSPLAIEGLLFALLVRPREQTEASPPWLARVIDALRDSLASRPSLHELARIAGVHPAHLCREFHRRTGRTIGAYLRELRVSRACTLLARSSTPLADIALACGFADQSHFATTFRRALHVTPGQYRSAARK